MPLKTTIRRRTVDPLNIDIIEFSEEIESSTFDEETKSLIPKDNDNDEEDVSSSDPDGTTRINKILFVIVVIFFTIILTAPAETKRIRKERNDKQVVALSNSIKKQKVALTKKYNVLKSTILTESNNLNDVVSKDYHEEKISSLQSSHEQEINRIKKDHEDILSKKEKLIDELKVDIDKHKKELQIVTSQLDGLKDEADEFCNDCSYNVAGLHVTCGDRLDFLVRRYGGDESDYKDAIIEKDSNCKA